MLGLLNDRKITELLILETSLPVQMEWENQGWIQLTQIHLSNGN